MLKVMYIKPYTVTTRNSNFSSSLENIIQQQFNPDSPNAVWCTDITYIWTLDGFVYLTSIMDLYSRKIIGWTFSKTLEVSCVLDTINKAKATRKLTNPLVIHSDRGSQYVSKEYQKAASKMTFSYSKKGCPWDNAYIESFHSLIKREWLNQYKIRDYDHARKLVFEYIVPFITLYELIATTTINRQISMKHNT
ncbi:IS3 family transposase [Thermoanaerobacterium sp. R66]|nr:IS3 family transposase [Thermoanaerobacterium sp. R66]MDE4542227.1 IS3 family transposase [Thermoanaerobacterium sp. R66]